MKRWASKGLLLLGVSVLLAPAALTQEGPESLLPDIFGPAEEAPPPPEVVQPAIPNDPAAQEPLPAAPEPEAPPAEVVSTEDSEENDPLDGDRGYADIGLVGPLTPARGGYGRSLFAGSNGALLGAWLERIDTPLASRWAHIVLRRALLTRAPTPPGIRDADWVAARVLMLTRMGEADGAKLLLRGLPLDRYTPELYSVASQAHLAAADIPALCPLAPTARAISKDDFWRLADAICAGLDGDDTTATGAFNRLRRERSAETIDLLLAERLTGIAGETNRAANLDWEGSSRLNAYRFGMAAASGAEIPDRLWSAASPAVAGWAFRTAAIDLDRRAQLASIAATAGIVSARELGALASLRADRAGADDPPAEVELLRTAYTGRTQRERVTAIAKLVEAGTAAGNRYASLLLTGTAAAQLAPDADLLPQAEMLIEAMLASGRIEDALDWWPLIETQEDAIRLRLWPLLVLADDRNRIPIGPGLARAAYKAMAADDEAEARRHMRWLIAGLDGLGRIDSGGWESLSEDFGVGSRNDIHTQALARAAGRNSKGDVAILAALGLQGRWSLVLPEDLKPVLAALSGVGLETEARLMAIEALTRAP